MPVQILTARLLTDGVVLAVRQAPFFVFEPGETREQAVRELAEQAEQLVLLAEEIEAARHDPDHRRHHWWMP